MTDAPAALLVEHTNLTPVRAERLARRIADEWLPAPLDRDALAIQRVREALHCSQCGKSLADRACGPSHALLAADPARHRTFTDAVDGGEHD